jgi:hypothetical protein
MHAEKLRNTYKINIVQSLSIDLLIEREIGREHVIIHFSSNCDFTH